MYIDVLHYPTVAEAAREASRQLRQGIMRAMASNFDDQAEICKPVQPNTPTSTAHANTPRDPAAVYSTIAKRPRRPPATDFSPQTKPTRTPLDVYSAVTTTPRRDESDQNDKTLVPASAGLDTDLSPQQAALTFKSSWNSSKQAGPSILSKRGRAQSDDESAKPAFMPTAKQLRRDSASVTGHGKGTKPIEGSLSAIETAKKRAAAKEKEPALASKATNPGGGERIGSTASAKSTSITKTALGAKLTTVAKSIATKQTGKTTSSAAVATQPKTSSTAASSTTGASSQKTKALIASPVSAFVRVAKKPAAAASTSTKSKLASTLANGSKRASAGPSMPSKSETVLDYQRGVSVPTSSSTAAPQLNAAARAAVQAKAFAPLPRSRVAPARGVSAVALLRKKTSAQTSAGAANRAARKTTLLDPRRRVLSGLAVRSPLLGAPALQQSHRAGASSTGLSTSRLPANSATGVRSNSALQSAVGSHPQALPPFYQKAVAENAAGALAIPAPSATGLNVQYVPGSETISGVRPNGYTVSVTGVVKPIVTFTPKSKLPHRLRQVSLEKLFEGMRDHQKMKEANALATALKTEQEMYAAAIGRADYREAITVKLKELRS